MDIAPRRKQGANKAFSVSLLLPQPKEQKEVTLERLLAAQKKLAIIIAAGNEQYLPLFQRLKKEIDEYQEKADDLKLALKIAAS